MYRYSTFITSWLFIILISAFSVNGQVSEQTNAEKSELKKEHENQFEISKNLEIYIELFKELNSLYVDEINPAQLIQLSIKEMLRSLDPYTVFYPESALEDFRFMTTGNYGGIGATISKKGDYVIISEPYESFPAQKCGMMAGDKILQIDGKDAKGMSTDDVSNLLKGQPGTEAHVLLQRQGTDAPFELLVMRENIQIKNVPYYGMLNENVGYIILSGFKNNAAEDVKKALLDLQSKHEIKALVLDLRSNPGGLLMEAVKLAALFVDKGELIVSTRGKVENWNKEYRTFDNPVAKDLPLAILTNGGSASASEIVAGTLQDLDRAVIIGERTLGKGLVQTTRSLTYNTQLKVTTSKYYIPSGRCIQEIDYSHKGNDGKAFKVPDSLISEFTTRNGRKVYDGKGIKPDIEISLSENPVILQSIYSDFLSFDFATTYRLSHPSIDSPEVFNLSDAEYNEFIDFVAGKNLTYKNPSEKALENFKAKAKGDDYFDAIADDYKRILEKIDDQKRKDVIKYKSEIIRILENDIVSRYYYQTGRIKSSLTRDPEIKEALKIFAEMDNYTSLLKGNN
ncbi:S41 family peptidase [Bacteroidota bacterium]